MNKIETRAMRCARDRFPRELIHCTWYLRFVSKAHSFFVSTSSNLYVSQVCSIALQTHAARTLQWLSMLDFSPPSVRRLPRYLEWAYLCMYEIHLIWESQSVYYHKRDNEEWSRRMTWSRYKNRFGLLVATCHQLSAFLSWLPRKVDLYCSYTYLDAVSPALPCSCQKGIQKTFLFSILNALVQSIQVACQQITLLESPSLIGVKRRTDTRSLQVTHVLQESSPFFNGREWWLHGHCSSCFHTWGSIPNWTPRSEHTPTIHPTKIKDLVKAAPLRFARTCDIWLDKHSLKTETFVATDYNLNRNDLVTVSPRRNFYRHI